MRGGHGMQNANMSTRLIDINTAGPMTARLRLDADLGLIWGKHVLLVAASYSAVVWLSTQDTILHIKSSIPVFLHPGHCWRMFSETLSFLHLLESLNWLGVTEMGSVERLEQESGPSLVSIGTWLPCNTVRPPAATYNESPSNSFSVLFQMQAIHSIS